jgi:cystathionine beta-lyase
MALDPTSPPAASAADDFDFDALDLAWLQAKPGAKWQRHGPDRLAAWVADMDFPTPSPVVAALHRFVDCGDLGYPDWLGGGSPLRALFAERMAARFGWSPGPQHVREVCEVVQGLQWILHLATPVDSLLALHVPAYPPFLDTSSAMSRPILPIPAERTGSGWAFDHDRFAADLAAAGGRCRALLLCNPQNPTGHVFTEAELERLAALAEEHDLLVSSDEIHADLVYPPATHVPIAALDPAIAARTVTLTSATKAFNIAGVRCAVAHLGSEAMRQAWEAQPRHLFGVVSPLGVEATRAAWEDGGDWLDALVVHLDRNRRLVGSLLAASLPDAGYVPPEATYLAWLDLRALRLAEPPHSVLRDGGAVLSPGPDFGPQGEGFVRLNFATSATVLEALVARMASAVARAPRRAEATTA